MRIRSLPVVAARHPIKLVSLFTENSKERRNSKRVISVPGTFSFWRSDSVRNSMGILRLEPGILNCERRSLNSLDSNEDPPRNEMYQY